MIGAFPLDDRRPDDRRPPDPPHCSCWACTPSALHVRWQRPDGITIGALAVDDEPTHRLGRRRTKPTAFSAGAPPWDGATSGAAELGSCGYFYPFANALGHVEPVP